VVIAVATFGVVGAEDLLYATGLPRWPSCRHGEAYAVVIAPAARAIAAVAPAASRIFVLFNMSVDHP